MRKHVLLLFFFLFALVCQAQTVFKTRTGSKYHVETCRYLKTSIETTVAQAQADGLTACSVCRPGTGKSGAAASSSFTSESEGGTSTTTSSDSSSGSVQCSGTTKAGARCKRMTTSTNGRCYQH